MEKTALTKVQRQAEEMIQEAVIANHTGEEIEQLVFHLGEINAANIISRNLESAVIVGLQRIRDERKYTALGYDRFDDFLDNWHRSPMKYKRFNHLEGIHEALGPAGFDLMRGSGLSYRQMKMLEAGDIVVEGQEVVIGGKERVSLGESRVVKDLVEKLIQERSAEKAENEKLANTVEKQKDQIERGRDELAEKQRFIDSLDEGTPYERALMAAIKALITLTGEVKALSPDEQAERGPIDLPTLAGQFYQVEQAFGQPHPIRNFNWTSVSPAAPVEEMSDDEKRETFLDRHPELLDASDLDEAEDLD